MHRVSEMNGVGRRMPLTTAAFTVAALGMIGVPPLAGYISKWYLKKGAITAGDEWVAVVLAVSSLLNAAYFLPILYRAWFLSPPKTWPHEHRLRQVGNQLDAADRAAGHGGAGDLGGRVCGIARSVRWRG